MANCAGCDAEGKDLFTCDMCRYTYCDSCFIFDDDLCVYCSYAYYEYYCDDDYDDWDDEDYDD